MQLELFTAIISRGWLNTWKEVAAASFSISTNFLLQACCVQPNHPVLVLKLGDSREAKQHRAGFLISLFAIKSIKKSKMAKKWLLEMIKQQRKGRDLS